MFVKVIEGGSWDGPGMEQPVQRIKVSSRGLIGNDRTDFLEKRAASPIFADKLAQVNLQPGDIPVHLVAIGATEAYGPNRNGDGFKEATCREIHHTFVKNAKYFQNHKNRDPSAGYGKVALSVYNEPMRRIELLVIGNGTKEAADRNGGLVLPERTLSRIENGEDVPHSMACKVAYDVCQNCFHKAANRSQYCTDSTCISPSGRRMFGCRNGLTKVASDGTQQYVENPGAQMFDISFLSLRPADRIAYGGLADYMQKAASDDQRMLGGADLAEWWSQHGADFDDFRTPLETVFHHDLQQQMKTARSLAEIERRIEDQLPHRAELLSAHLSSSVAPRSDFDVTHLGRSQEKVAMALGALAQHKVMIPLPAFLKAATGESGDAVAALSEKVARHLPGVFSRLTADPQLEAILQSNAFAPSGQLASKEVRAWAESQVPGYSLDDNAFRERVWRSTINRVSPATAMTKDAMIKTAAPDDANEKLARQYACYQLAFLTAAADEADYRPLCERAVMHNYVSL